MATSQKLTEHFLTCTICTEVFDKPCTLVCNHTFCRKCVVSYTKTRPEAISAKSLLCPFCSKMTKVSAPERPVEEWADDVKPSFVIQGLLDSFGPGCKDTTFCRYCGEEGETTPATVWCSVCDDALCERCTRMHNRIPATRHHDVTELTGEVKVTRRRKATCKDHKDENIKLLCKDCQKAVCQTCCTIYHRKCESVVTIESEVMAMKKELTNNKLNLCGRKDEKKFEMEKTKSQMDEEITRYSQMESDIKSTSIEAIEEIKQKEVTLLNELKEMSNKHIGQLKADIKLSEMSVQMYEHQTKMIDQVLQSDCDMDVYEMYQGCEAGDVEAVGDADLKEKGRIASIMFRQDTDKLSRALDDLQLGEIDVLFEGVLDPKATPVLQDTISALDLKAAPVLQDTINISEEEDKPGADPIDVTVLEVDGMDTVVVTDYNMKSVRSFYTRNKQRGHSRLGLGGPPWGITTLKDNQVAVTVLGSRQIVTLQVNPDLVLLSTITTCKQYMGITSLPQSSIAAGAFSPPCVDILDITGKVLRSISALGSGESILHYPNFLCTTRTGNILVSDIGSMLVLCLTREGDVVFTFPRRGDTTLRSPRGITSTTTGDILVADHPQHSVVHLTESGQFVRTLLTADDGATCPFGVCVDGFGHVFICNRYTGEIKVFTCSNTHSIDHGFIIN